jgi:23S rRNA (adenine2503-C2)-methyltransferase
MKVVATAGDEKFALVYIAEMSKGRLVEFVESIQPPIPRSEKWVLLVSTLFGCPVGCQMCDAGGHYQGKPSKEEIFEQIDYLVDLRYPGRTIPCDQFKIQFARMGEPSLNTAVLDVLDELPKRYQAPGLMPSISTIAPAGTQAFFERLYSIKNEHYAGGHFQFQYSIHTTDIQRRDQLIPINTWDFSQMAEFGERFYTAGDRKITLNFALAKDTPLDARVLKRFFDPDKYLVKITPLNPTYSARENALDSHLKPLPYHEDEIVTSLSESGYQVIVSIGELEENFIGSNCGQYIRSHLNAEQPLNCGYTYSVEQINCGESVGHK